jgi:hypothetical protein
MALTRRTPVQMRTSNSILLVALVCSGCIANQDGIPIPVTTPFERFSVEESEYLRLFRAGYESGCRGYRSTYCLFGADFQKPILVARSQGWTDGQGEGYLVWADAFERAVAEKDRGRLLKLFQSLGDDARAAVDDVLADRSRRTP